MSLLSVKAFAPLLVLGGGIYALTQTQLIDKYLNFGSSTKQEQKIDFEVSAKCNFAETGPSVPPYSSFPSVGQGSLNDYFLISCPEEPTGDDSEDNSWMGLFPKTVFKREISGGESEDSQINISYEINRSTDKVTFKSDKFNNSILSTTFKNSDSEEGIINLTTEEEAKDIYILGAFDDCEIESLA